MSNKHAIIVYLLVPHWVLATNYYVTTNGDNNNNGLSLTSAFATIQHPIDQLILAAGDTLFVADGNYSGFDNRDISGTAPGWGSKLPYL